MNISKYYKQLDKKHLAEV